MQNVKKLAPVAVYVAAAGIFVMWLLILFSLMPSENDLKGTFGFPIFFGWGALVLIPPFLLFVIVRMIGQSLLKENKEWAIMLGTVAIWIVVLDFARMAVWRVLATSYIVVMLAADFLQTYVFTRMATHPITIIAMLAIVVIAIGILVDYWGIPKGKDGMKKIRGVPLSLVIALCGAAMIAGVIFGYFILK